MGCYTFCPLKRRDYGTSSQLILEILGCAVLCLDGWECSDSRRRSEEGWVGLLYPFQSALHGLSVCLCSHLDRCYLLSRIHSALFLLARCYLETKWSNFPSPRPGDHRRSGWGHKELHPHLGAFRYGQRVCHFPEMGTEIQIDSWKQTKCKLSPVSFYKINLDNLHLKFEEKCHVFTLWNKTHMALTLCTWWASADTDYPTPMLVPES